MPRLLHSVSTWEPPTAFPNEVDPPERLRKVTDMLPPDRRFTHSWRIELRDGERPTWDPPANERQMIQCRPIFHDGGTYWVEWWDRFAPSWPINPQERWQIAPWQIHADDDGQAPVNIEVVGDRRRLRIAGSACPGGEDLEPDWPLARGEWHHFRLGWTQSDAASRGSLRLYRDERLLIDRPRYAVSRDRGSLYPSMLVYRAATIDGTAIVHMAGWQVWDGDPGYPAPDLVGPHGQAGAGP
jgi:Polysaccharide lyase